MGKFSFALKTGVVFMFGASLSFALPKSSDLVEDMGLGYNIGNTMEVPAGQGGPTGWGNPMPSPSYIKAIKDAGFNTVRIPTAWFSHAKNGQISKAWIDTVQTVVDMCLKENMYVILNSHWDTGWLEDNVFAESEEYVTKLQKNFWSHIADRFKEYDEHVIFASANEPGVNDPWKNGSQLAFDATRQKILQKYHQAMIDAVRKSGGNNETRTIVFQMPRTEIDNYKMLTDNYPVDPTGKGYTMAEAHYYPYQFSLMTEDEDWGKQFFYYTGFESTTDKEHNMGWNVYSNSIDDQALGTPKQIAKAFGELKTAFCDKGIPVIIGEMGAIKRLELTGENLKLHLQGRAAWYGDVAAAAKERGIVPVIWDTGDEGNGNMTVIRRQKNVENTIFDYETLNAMRKAYGMNALEGNSIDALVEQSTSTVNKSALGFFDSKNSKAEAATMRFAPTVKDWSSYESVTLRVYSDITVSGSWSSIDLAMMTGSSWDWFDTHIDDQLVNKKWVDVTVKLTDFTTTKDYTLNLKSVNALVLNVYSDGVAGKIAVDEIVLNKKDGTKEVVESFKAKTPEIDGYYKSVELVKTEDVESASASSTTPSGNAFVFKANSYTDTFKYAETVNDPTAIKHVVSAPSKMLVNVTAGRVSAMFQSATANRASVTLLNAAGQVIARQNMVTKIGANEVAFETPFRGNAFVVVKQGSQKFVQAVRIK